MIYVIYIYIIYICLKIELLGCSLDGELLSGSRWVCPWSHQHSIFRSAHWIERFFQTRMAPYWWWKHVQKDFQRKNLLPKKTIQFFSLKKIHHGYFLLHIFQLDYETKPAIFRSNHSPCRPQTVRASQQAPSARRGNSPTNAAESDSHTFGRFFWSPENKIGDLFLKIK